MDVLNGFFVDVVRLCIWLVLLTAIFVPMERFFARTPAKFLRPQIGNDLGYYFLSSLLPAALMSLPLAVLATMVQRVVPGGFHAAVHELPLWLRIALGLVVADVGSYWGHRASHAWALLWRFHVLHHSAEHIDFLVNGRAHPVDLVWVRMCGLVPLYLLGLASAGAAGSMVPVIVTLVGTVASFFVHANVRWRLGPLEWLVATPAFHHWHHSRTDHIDHNFAATFPWIDRVFGTHWLPGHFPADYGVEEPMPETMTGQLVAPFGKIRPGRVRVQPPV
jgi:sterol desaturase/sphingolipid hydroxylase (fatty acid hydroxylase superfamily)